MSEPLDDDRARDLGGSLGEWVVGLTSPSDFGGKPMTVLPFIGPESPPLPFVVVELLSLDTAPQEGGFVRADVQQVDLLAYTFEITPVLDFRDPDGADAMVKTVVARMLRSLRGDATLGGRVGLASPSLRAEFDEPLIRWESGVIGRQAVVTMQVADLVQDPQTAGKWW